MEEKQQSADLFSLSPRRTGCIESRSSSDVISHFGQSTKRKRCLIFYQKTKQKRTCFLLFYVNNRERNAGRKTPRTHAKPTQNTSTRTTQHMTPPPPPPLSRSRASFVRGSTNLLLQNYKQNANIILCPRSKRAATRRTTPSITYRHFCRVYWENEPP